MPPKRGGERGRGRGRGKGGRGDVSAAIPDAQPDHNEADVEQQPNEPAAIIPPPKTITPSQDFQDDDMDVDPNSSPATQPTETPAPTPIRPPILPSPSLGSGSPAPPPKKQSKFKPKNVRRTQEELRELQEKERLRREGLNAAAARERRLQPRRPGRGDAMGMGRGRNAPAAASGPFALGVADEKKNAHRQIGSSYNSGGGGGSGASGNFGGGSGGGGGGGGGTSGSGTRVKTEGFTTINSDGSGVGGRSKPEDFFPEPEYPDDDDTPRVDIEQINLLSSDEDEPIVTGSRNRGMVNVNGNKGGQKPIRLQRYEHKNRVAQLNTDPTVKLEPEKVKEDPDAVLVDEARSTAVVSGASHTKNVFVKAEPGTAAADQPPSSPIPEFKQPLTEFDDVDVPMEGADPGQTGENPKPEAVPTPKREPKPRRHSKKDKKPVLQTAEDRAEYDRHIEDMRVLRDELGNMHTSRDGEDNLEMEDEVAEGNKEGRLYLFQLPPVLPKLYNPMTQSKPLPPGQIPIVIKDEKDGDVEMADTSNKYKVGLNKGKQPAKPDNGETILIEDDSKKDGRRGREKYVEEEGYIGKLIVRESGRVELDWGGTRMLVGRGIPTGFLTTGVLLDPMDPDKEKNDVLGDSGSSRMFQPAIEGMAVGMGEIMGKFVVTPDWESMM